MQSSWHNSGAKGLQEALHVAVIMDGNGRWATRRGLPRSAGHKAGVNALRDIVKAAPGLGITTLTVFAFSQDNWRRPAGEVSALMTILRRYLLWEVPRLAKEGLRISVIGRRDRLPQDITRAIADVERRSQAGDVLHLRIALDYSSRDAILEAAEALKSQELLHAGAASVAQSPGGLANASFAQGLAPDGGPTELDLLIRTGGEKRLSDFLLWEAAYAELYFTDRLWPDFNADELRSAVAEFHGRERRFGGLPNATAGSATHNSAESPSPYAWKQPAFAGAGE